MTNAELINRLRDVPCWEIGTETEETMLAAADALEAADEKITDYTAAIDALDDSNDAYIKENERLEKRIAELMPKEGEWIDGDARKVTARCSVCGHLRLGNGAKWANMYVPFCEICGAKMKGDNDEQIH